MATTPPFGSNIHGFEEFPRAREVLQAGISEGVFPGAVAGVWSRRDPDRYHFAWGGARRLGLKGLSPQAMERETIFDLASVSKVFATAALATVLVERGWIRWDAPVQSILAEFPHPQITLRQLASHTSGLPAWNPVYENLRWYFATDELEMIDVSERQAAARKYLFEISPERAPGESALYSDLGFMLLGFCLEEVTNLPLDRAVERFLWRPMGLCEPGNTGPFFVRTLEPAFRARNEVVAATEDCPWRRSILQGQVHDDNCWAMGGYAGHAGAFGTARNLLRFGQGLLDGFISRQVLKETWTRVARPAGCDRTPGWDTPSGESPALGKFFSTASVGHLGYTGTSFWIDPRNEIVVTLLTNRVHPTRENILIRPFRARFHDALARDLISPSAG